jgi:hypothetical protein
MKFISKATRLFGFFFVFSGVLKMLIGNPSPTHYSPPTYWGVMWVLAGIVLLAVGARAGETTQRSCGGSNGK